VQLLGAMPLRHWVLLSGWADAVNGSVVCFNAGRRWMGLGLWMSNPQM
jgi:hypothetical protein